MVGRRTPRELVPRYAPQATVPAIVAMSMDSRFFLTQLSSHLSLIGARALLDKQSRLKRATAPGGLTVTMWPHLPAPPMRVELHSK
jgi:hypothetical protein